MDVCVCHYLLNKCHFPFTRKTTISCFLPLHWSTKWRRLPVTADTQSRTHGAQHSSPERQKRQCRNVNEIFQSTQNPPPLLLSSLENAKPSPGLLLQCLPHLWNRRQMWPYKIDHVCDTLCTHTHTYPNVKSKYDFFSTHTCTHAHTQRRPEIQSR